MIVEFLTPSPILPVQIASHALVPQQEVSFLRPWRASGPLEQKDVDSLGDILPLATYGQHEINYSWM